jgi:hypothetical protein
MLGASRATSSDEIKQDLITDLPLLRDAVGLPAPPRG